MSDLKLRELRRRAEATGTVEDEVIYLRERLRLGQLTKRRLLLAADVGHRAAAVVLERPEKRPEGFDRLLAVTSKWGLHVPLRGVVGAFDDLVAADDAPAEAVQLVADVRELLDAPEEERAPLRARIEPVCRRVSEWNFQFGPEYDVDASDWVYPEVPPGLELHPLFIHVHPLGVAALGTVEDPRRYLRCALSGAIELGGEGARRGYVRAICGWALEGPARGE
jgi:hypothetical protein